MLIKFTSLFYLLNIISDICKDYKELTHDVELVNMPQFLPDPIFPGSEEDGLAVFAVPGPRVIPVVVDLCVAEVRFVRRQVGADVTTDDDAHALAVDVVELSVVFRRLAENVDVLAVDSVPVTFYYDYH
jgi:hypothetical protein